jgi:nicotinamide-nucleotide amidase
LPYDSFTLHTTGRPESAIDQKIHPIIRRKRNLRKEEWLNFCILAHERRVDVKVEARAETRGRLKSILDGVKREFLRVIGANVYGQDGETLESIVGKLLTRKKLTLTLAESCTGGLLGEMITRIPGSSAYFVSSFVAYSNDAKQKLLGVREETLKKHGAVSAETAIEMAEGARGEADIGLSVTGIAGPEGGSRQKPVGLVFIGFSGLKRRFVQRHLFPGDRQAIRERAAKAALNLLRQELGR